MRKASFVIALTVLLFACKENKPTTTSVDTLQIDTSKIISPTITDNRQVAVDISPMDMSYFPPNYPQLKMANHDIGLPVMRVIYSRPHLQGRSLFPDILKYGEVWRLGANEATELDVFLPVKMGDKKLAPGRYALYCIPKENEWTIVINKDVDVWGLKQDVSKDVHRITVPTTKENYSLEYFTIYFEKTKNGGNMILGWDATQVKVPFEL